MSKDSEWSDKLDFALSLADEAGQLIFEHFRKRDFSVEWKGDRSPVTVADRGAEQLLRKRISEQFPTDGILGEEYGEQTGTSGFRWILDPIDGTKAFMHGVEQFGLLIGLEWQNRIVVGVCGFPALHEVVYAAEGAGAWHRCHDEPARPAAVSPVSQLSQALFCFTEISGWDKTGRRQNFDAMQKATRVSRGWGDCFGHILVATGRAEVMIDPLLNPWDASPLICIVQEAGGHFLDFDGQPSIYSGCGLSVNAALKDEVLGMLQRQS